MEQNREMPVPRATPRDFFLHLLLFIALYISVISFIMLIWQYVNVLLPDPLTSDYYSAQSAYSGIRWSISMLVIFFPVFIGLSWYMDKLDMANPERRKFRSKKWLTYFTLFVAALTIIVDLVTLIYNLLGGELTLNFAIKVLAVLFAAVLVFGYYFWDLKKKGEE